MIKIKLRFSVEFKFDFLIFKRVLVYTKLNDYIEFIPSKIVLSFGGQSEISG